MINRSSISRKKASLALLRAQRDGQKNYEIKSKDDKRPDDILTEDKRIIDVEIISDTASPKAEMSKDIDNNFKFSRESEIDKFKDFIKTQLLNSIGQFFRLVIALFKFLWGNNANRSHEDASFIPGYDNDKIRSKEQQLKQSITVSSKNAVRVIAVMVGLFIVWGGLAPLKSAVVASGFVVVEGYRKTVQHLEGGIISEILVKEGDVVTINQPLLYLNSTAANAEQQLVLGQYMSALATENRLSAERDNLAEIKYSDELYEYTAQDKIIELIDSQDRLFSTRRDALKGKIDILNEKIRQYAKQIVSLEAQVRELNKQLSIVSEQVDVSQELFDKGYGQKPKLLEYKNTYSALKSKNAELEGQIATSNGSISEAKFQIINEKNTFLKEVMDELKEVQQKISGYREQLQASRYVLERTVIRAPQEGKVTNLRQHTVGGVVAPGAPLLDIVPQDEKFLIEAHVNLQDIDIVHENQEAKVMLSAYRSRIAPRVNGVVQYISADKLADEKAGTQYYLAHIAVDKDEIKKAGENIALYPGMPAEIFITTGSTTMLKYLLKPIVESFFRSVRD